MIKKTELPYMTAVQVTANSNDYKYAWFSASSHKHWIVFLLNMQ